MPPYATTASLLLATIAQQQAAIAELSASPLGILSGPAIRRALRTMPGPIDVIALDFRKLHEWNELLGYNVASEFLARFCQTRSRARRRGDRRALDVRGQWGGDEIVIACAAGSGQGLLMRLVWALDRLSAQLTAGQRAAIAERTGGLIDGFAAVFVLVERSHAPLVDASRAVDECGVLKRGRQTGERAGSGATGTIIGTIQPS